MSIVKKNMEIADWVQLREQAMALIQVMNAESRQWTDYNTHDPGITILESLCYAISDLSNRIALPIEDLLYPAAGVTDAQANSQDALQTFFTAPQVLPNAPLTLEDYRRWFIDQSGVNNAWLHYNVHSASYFAYLYLDSSISKVSYKEIENEILAKDVNIGERFALVKSLPKVSVKIYLDLTLDDNANQTTVKAGLAKCLSQFFSKTVSTKNFSQMRHSGHDVESIDVESIMSGPLPINGFVTKAELERTDVDGFDDNIQPVFSYNFSELEKHIKQIKGVNKVDVTKVKVGDNEVDFESFSTEKINILTAQLANLESASVTLTQNSFAHTINLPFNVVDSLKQASNIKIDFPQGKDQNLSSYSSFQEDLPEYYGLNQNTWGDQNKTNSKAEKDDEYEKVTQLKHYLTLFDQTLCDYFSQLGHVSGMLAMVQPPNNNPPPACFTQKLPAKALTDSDKFYSSLKIKDKQCQSQMIQQNFTQKNALLDHLLALFSETYIPQNIYKELQGISDKNIEDTEYLYSKQHYLNSIVLLRAGRGQVNNLKKIIALKLGLTEDQVVITDLVLGQPLPMPCNEISSDAARPLENSFKVAKSPCVWLSKITVYLPRKFDASISSNAGANSLHSYAKSILDAEVPAHIYYEVNYADAAIGQSVAS